MTRPKCCRRIGHEPGARYFIPGGTGNEVPGETVLTLDEFEALRLADYQGLYQEQAAAQMNVSRQTFGRIVDSARRKIAEALVHGMALRIEGGEVEMAPNRKGRCRECSRYLEEPCAGGEEVTCPRCRKKISPQQKGE